MKYVLDYLDWYYKRFGAECIGCDVLSMNFPLICDFHDNVDGCSMSVDVDGDIWIIKYIGLWAVFACQAAPAFF